MSDTILRIHVTSDFEKTYKKLPSNIRLLTEKKDKWFRANPFDSRLKTHRLKGELKGYWSYSVNYHIRVLFKFISAHEVIYYDIGTHEIYR
jgi:mRNA-degrading endonuclease YafQ of YafQ-DinJ toxin-antitoxin module